MGRREVVIAALAILAAPLVPAQDGAEPHVTDPAGDAREWDTYALRTTACERSESPGDCYERTAALPVAGGVPAPPEADFLSATFSDTPQDLVVEVEMSRVDPTFAAVVPTNGDAFSINVCWAFVPEASCVNDPWWSDGKIYLWYWVVRNEGTVEAWSGINIFGDEACAPSGGCVYRADVEVLPGAPGKLRWTVPRVVLPAAEAGDVVRAPLGGTSKVYRGYDAPAVGASGAAPAWFAVDNWVYHTLDYAPDARDFVFSTERDTEDAPWYDAFEDPPGDVRRPTAARNGYRPDLDILHVRLVEDPQALSVVVEIAAVEETAQPHGYFLGVGTTAGPAVLGGYDVVDGARVPWGLVCKAGACSDLPVNVTFAPGAPGTVTVAFDRRHLGSPSAGDRVTMVAAGTWWSDEAVLATADAPARLHAGAGSFMDFTGFAPYFRFAMDSAAPAEDGRVVVLADDVGDVELPLLVTDRDLARQYDLTYVEAKGLADGRVRFTLGVQDLSRVSIPLGYQAVVYAVGVETEKGAFMVGYYKDDERGRQEYFCAPDTVVLTPDKRDPNEVVWSEIQGFLAVGRGSAEATGGGGSGSSYIAFDAPHSCFGEEGAGALAASRLGAASFLVQNPSDRSAEVAVLDDHEAAGPFVVQPPAVPAARVPWHVRPFGLDNFWDMLGIALAVVVSGAGAAVVQRRRGALRRYLAEIERTVAEKGRDPKAVEADLRALRARVKTDVVRGRISEGHFVIVERRIDELLARARIEILAHAFGDLPYRVLQRVQELLADGAMSEADYRVVCTLLEQTGLREDAKDGIRRALRLWVAQDGNA